MWGRKLESACLVILLALVFSVAALGQTPTYQLIPDETIASGIADTSGPGGVAYVEYWVWDGDNGYYYYTYRIHNAAFEPFIKHLTIGNPSGDPYVVTGSSGGGSEGGTAWAYATHASLPTVVDWVASDSDTVVYPGQSSWQAPLFQFASKLPPSSAAVTVRQGDLSTYATGLIPAPGGVTSPRSHGYWKHQFSGKGNRKEAPSLPGYLNSIEMYSNVSRDDLAGTISQDLAFASATLEVADSSDMRSKAKRELLALWLNVVSQKLNYYGPAKFDLTAVTTTATTIGEAIVEIEATILNAGATLAELENVKDMAEMLNVD